MPDDLATLSDMEKEVLVKPILKREIYQTLNSIPHGKAPSPDGLNVEFYIFFIRTLFLTTLSMLYATSLCLLRFLLLGAKPMLL